VAVAAKKRVVINRGRKRNPRRKLSAKQIKYFGTPAQKAAQKASRHRKRSKANKGAPFSRKARMNRKAKSHRRRTSPRRRTNPGDILSLAFNPGQKRRKTMAATKRRRRRARAGQRRNTTRRRHMRANPAVRRHNRRRHHTVRHRRNRRNPSSSGNVTMKSAMMILGGGAVGYFGSKGLTQAVLGANNTGVNGYAVNALVTAGLALAAHMFKLKNVSVGILAGGAIQLIQRIVTDKTPIGQIGQSLGVGDYQMQNFVTPQRLVDPLNSAAIEIPAGWGAPAVVVNGAAPPGGVHGYNAPGPGLYSGKGLYS